MRLTVKTVCVYTVWFDEKRRATWSHDINDRLFVVVVVANLVMMRGVTNAKQYRIEIYAQRLIQPSMSVSILRIRRCRPSLDILISHNS